MDNVKWLFLHIYWTSRILLLPNQAFQCKSIFQLGNLLMELMYQIQKYYNVCSHCCEPQMMCLNCNTSNQTSRKYWFCGSPSSKILCSPVFVTTFTSSFPQFFFEGDEKSPNESFLAYSVKHVPASFLGFLE